MNAAALLAYKYRVNAASSLSGEEKHNKNNNLEFTLGQRIRRSEIAGVKATYPPPRLRDWRDKGLSYLPGF